MSMRFPDMRSWKAATAVAIALVLTACAATPSTLEQAVRQRAEQYWKARMANQNGAAYAMLTPAYRKLKTEAQYAQEFGVASAVKSVDVIEVTCTSAERCIANVRLNTRPMVPGVEVGTVATHVNDVWLLEGGQWWRHQAL